MNCWSPSTVHLRLGWLHKVWGRHQTLCPLRNMQLAWLDRDSGIQQGTHRWMLSLGRTFRRHWVDTARGSFKIKADKYQHMKPDHCHGTALKHLPDSLKSLWTLEKLTWYFCLGFIEYVWGNYEGNHNIFLLKNETRRKNTERPDVPYQVNIFR